jgi:hypothetical protein
MGTEITLWRRAAGGMTHWDTPLSGAQYRGRKGMNPVFRTDGMRPVVGSEYLRISWFLRDMRNCLAFHF